MDARHLKQESLVDLALGEGDPEARRHAEACASCRSAARELEQLVATARLAEVPEPPGMYWQAFATNVGRRIAQSTRLRPLEWLWRLLPAASAVAALLVFVPDHVPNAPAGTSTGALPAWVPLPPADEDPALVVVEAAVDVGDGGERESEVDGLLADTSTWLELAELSAGEAEALTQLVEEGRAL